MSAVRMRRPRRTVLTRAAAWLLLACSAVAHGGPYPEHAIKAVVPFPPGGGTDVFARAVAEPLGKTLGQPVVVENRGGADGNIGMELVARSAPDGYTILFNSSAATVNPVMYRNLRFDPARELRPVAVLCEYYNLIVVNAEKVPARTLSDFIDVMRRNPGKLNFAANGARLGIELFKQAAGVDVAVIPYRGAGDAITALLRGDADFMIVNAPGLLQHIASGKLRALATTGPRRDPDLANVPTTAEAGLPQFTYSSFFGAYVPAGTPNDIVDRLGVALNQAAALPEVVASFRSNGATPVQGTPDTALRRYQSEIARYRDIVQRANIPPVD